MPQLGSTRLFDLLRPPRVYKFPAIRSCEAPSVLLPCFGMGPLLPCYCHREEHQILCALIRLFPIPAILRTPRADHEVGLYPMADGLRTDLTSASGFFGPCDAEKYRDEKIRSNSCETDCVA